MLRPSETAQQMLASLLLERAGLKVTPDGYHSLRLALSTRMPALGLTDAEEYVARLRTPEGEEELRALLPLVTVGHTEFFRDPRQFRALERVLLPEGLARARRDFRPVRVWSAGCATGEEPYSIAMVLHELGAKASDVDLWATDLNLAAVESARGGRFPPSRLRGMAEERRARFFRPVGEGEGWEVQPFLKDYVRFDGLNLAAPVFPVAPGSLDLILCRNVIIYFDLPTIQGLMERFLTALRPGGILLLGYSESLFKVYDRFEMIEVEGSFIYRRPLVARPPGAPLRALEPGMTAVPPRPPTAEQPAWRAKADATTPSRTSPAVPARTGVPSTATPPPRTRTGELPSVPPRTRTGELPAAAPPPRTATGELPALVPAPRTRTGELPAAVPPPRTRTGDHPVVTPQGAGAAPARTPVDRLNLAVHKMERGDFHGALAAVQRLLQDEPEDLDTLLTLGNLQSLLGKPDAAREAFAQALQREPLCVDARVFAGVAALQEGKLDAARGELSKALFLEPALAIGHYLLAQVEEKSGRHEPARRSYRNAISQLRFPQRPLAGHYPDILDSAEAIGRAARYALAALEEGPHR